jgi:hypothetical protein
VQEFGDDTIVPGEHEADIPIIEPRPHNTTTPIATSQMVRCVCISKARHLFMRRMTETLDKAKQNSRRS